MKSFREWKRGHVAEKKGALEELRLAIDYYKGNGLPQSYEQAIAWAKKALALFPTMTAAVMFLCIFPQLLPMDSRL